MNKRLDYIDSLKGFAIMLMVLCHSGLHNSATQWIYSFHMPLFFIVSGFLFSEPNSRNFLQYLRKKVKQLLVPFLIFSLVLCFGRRNYVDWCYILYGSRNALAEATTFTPLWFLPCFFLSTLIFRSAFYIPNDILRYVIICIIGITGFVLSRIMPSGAIGLPWNLNVALVGVFLMLIGFAIKKIKIGPILGGAILVLGSTMAFTNLPNCLTEGNPHVEMSIGEFGNPILFTATAAMITIGLLALWNKGENVRYLTPINKFMQWLGRNSLSVMCIHGVFLAPLSKLFKIGFLSTVSHSVIPKIRNYHSIHD